MFLKGKFFFAWNVLKHIKKNLIFQILEKSHPKKIVDSQNKVLKHQNNLDQP